MAFEHLYDMAEPMVDLGKITDDDRARILAADLHEVDIAVEGSPGGTIRYTSGPAIERPGDLAAVLTSLDERGRHDAS